MRDDYGREPAVKAYRTVVPMLESAKDAATRPTRAADLNLVYAFAKMMDPESVVRESETAGVVATASVADRLAGYIGQLNGQAMLSPETRQKLLSELESRFGALKASNDEITRAYTETAKSYGLNPDRILFNVRSGGSPQAPVAGPAPAPKSTPGQMPKITGNDDYAKLPSGTTFIAPDGTTRVKP
ncbi:hypothetical protein [Reyranella massiliensis]|uniref:hypothetical protein n=1 Tax=Reyranella massiliensis TaxID=445220 RepID=UPI0002EFC525|nr:hypothetical protein [Reyranella massiliensis]